MAKAKIPGEFTIRRGWLKFMYLYTVVGAGLFGLAVVAAPGLTASMSGYPAEDPVVFGIWGSIYVAFGILSIFGFFSPLKFSPVLMMQLLYKTISILFVILPIFIGGVVEKYAVQLVVLFVTYIIGDLIAIPFSYIFKKE
jgi:hypothetical protein